MRLSVCLAAALLLVLYSIAGADVEDKRVMNLDECVSTALSQHPSVNASQGRFDESRGKLDVVKGARRLQVDFHSEGQRYDWLPANKVKVLGGGNVDVYSALTLSKLLFSSGKAEAEIDSASSSLAASSEDMRRTRQEVTFNVAKSYYSLLKAQAILSAKSDAVRQMEQHLKVAQEKLDIGKAAKLDVLRAEVQLADVTQARLAAANQVSIAKLQLLNAMGVDSPNDDIAVADDRSPVEKVGDVDALLQEALSTHPDCVKGEMLVRSAQSRVRAARADSLPDLSFVASYNREGKDFPDISNWNTGLAVRFPIATGGIARARIDQANAIVQQNRSGIDLINQNVKLAVRSAVLSAHDAEERLKVTQKSVEQAREALTVAQEKYASGLGSTTEVIDTQVALTQAETNFAQALYDGKIASAQIQYAVGKDPAVTVASKGESR